MNRRPRPNPRAAPWLALALVACRGGGIAGDLARPAVAPQRIVAGSVFAAEVLVAIAPRDRIVGVHTLAADPAYSLVAAEVAGLPKVGAEPEQLLAVRPDLVVVDAFTRPETLAMLASAHVPVLRTATPDDFDGIAANVQRLGSVCHLETEAAALVAAMQERLGRLRQRGCELGAWRVCSLQGGLHTYGRGSLFGAVLAAVGAQNLAAERGAGPFRKLTVESLLAWRPDAIVVDGAGAPAATDGGGAVVPAWLGQVRGLDLLPCLQRGRIVTVPGALLGTTSHRLVEAAEFVQEILLAWGRP